MESNLFVQDPAHLFPVFPYVTDEQQLLACPDYVKAVKAHAEIAKREGLIVDMVFAGGQPYPVVHLTLRDGVSYGLSAMQATLMLMGVLHFHQLEPQESAELHKVLERRKPLAQRARNPVELERPNRLGDTVVDGGQKWAKRNAAKQETNAVINTIDMSEFDIDLDEFDFDPDD